MNHSLLWIKFGYLVPGADETRIFMVDCTPHRGRISRFGYWYQQRLMAINLISSKCSKPKSFRLHYPVVCVWVSPPPPQLLS